jgi:predicted HicB family RNase H-like nuclease
MKNVMEYKGYNARVEFDADDGCFVGRIVGINDIVGFHGTTVEGMKAAFQEAVDDYLATCRAAGKRPDRTYPGKIMVRFSPDLHADVAILAELEGTSVNQWVEKVMAEAAATHRATLKMKGVFRKVATGKMVIMPRSRTKKGEGVHRHIKGA